MADIKQAAKWLDEGKSIRRSGWWVRYKVVGNGVIRVFGKRKRLDWPGSIHSVNELLAEDWEIAPEPTKKSNTPAQ